MAKLLPYFKWYPGDAEGDDFYSLTLTNEELGIYHRLLNRAWMNDGITSDMDVLAAFCRMSRGQFDEVWKKLSKRWVVSPRDESKLVNPRQEEERASAKLKSENNKRDGNANAKGSRKERDAIDPLRAYESESGSSRTLKVIPSKKQSIRFPEFWAKYPRQFGEDSACRDWCSEVTSENETVAFACLDRYLASDEVQRGVVMSAGSTMKDTGWIVKCARDGWKCEWPKAREPTRAKGFVADVTEVMQRNMLEKGTPW